MLIILEVMNPKTGNKEVKAIFDREEFFKSYVKDNLSKTSVAFVSGIELNNTRENLSVLDELEIEELQEWMNELY